MGHRGRRVAALVLAGGLAGAALTVTTAGPAGAAEFFEVVGVQSGQTDAQFALCLNDASGFPARVEGGFTVTGGSVTTPSVSFTPSNTSQIIEGAVTCPDQFLSFSLDGMEPGTDYTISVQMTIIPKEEQPQGGFIDDTSRSTLSGSVSAHIVTVVADSGGGESGGASTGGDGAAGSTSGSGNAGGGGESGGTGSGSGAPPAIVIVNPSRFTAADLRALSPAQVSTIAPATFGQLPPATLRALTADQASELTPAQASSIRAARAAELAPRAVAALDPEVVAAMRPSAIKFLSPVAIGAMTTAQLKALTPRQIAALRPKQLAELSVAEKALLRRR